MWFGEQRSELGRERGVPCAEIAGSAVNRDLGNRFECVRGIAQIGLRPNFRKLFSMISDRPENPGHSGDDRFRANQQ